MIDRIFTSLTSVRHSRMTHQEAKELRFVYVIDDDESMREAICDLVRSVGLEARPFRSAKEFLLAEFPSAPSCLVLDIRLPGISGLDLQDNLASANIHIPIIFMTGHGDIPMSVRALKAGALEFLTKPFRDQDMLDAIQAGLERDRQRRAADDEASDLRSTFDGLTVREKEILGWVAAGLMNKQIAGKVGISEVTVKTHRGNLMRKMRAKSLADLVRIADALGIRPDSH